MLPAMSMRQHREEDWQFDTALTRGTARQIAYRYDQAGLVAPYLVCPCCAQGMRTSSVVRHHSTSRQLRDIEDDIDDDAENAEAGDIDDDAEDIDDAAENAEAAADAEANAEVSEEDGLASALDNLKRFARAVVEDCAHHSCQTHVTRMLKTLHATLFHLLPYNLKEYIPTDYRTLPVIAGTEGDPKYFFHEFCHEDHHRFDPADNNPTCTVCEKDTRYQVNGQPARKAIYFCLKDYVRRMLSLPGMLEAQLTWETRKARAGVFRDAADGSIMCGTHLSRIYEHVPPEQRKNCIIMAQCSDGTTIRANKRGALTPVTAVVLTLPAYVRNKFTCMYLAGVFPDGATSQVYHQAVAEMFAEVAPGTAGLQFQGQTFWVIRAWGVDDLGGIDKPINGKKYPSINGFCMQCQQQGCRSNAHGTTYYIGAFAHLEMGHELREEVAVAYEEEEHIAMRARTWPKPRNMTARLAHASATRSDTFGPKQWAVEHFHGFNVYTQLLYYFNVVYMTINDPFHEIANTIKDIFNLVANTEGAQMYFKKNKKAYERSIGRFEGVGGKKHPAPFQAPHAVVKKLDDYVEHRLKLPTAWAPLRYLFDHHNRLSMSERISLAGPLGLYFLGFCELADDVRDAFVELLLCLEALQAKEHTTGSLKSLQTRIILVLTRCEQLLPLYWNTSVRHHLLHLVSCIERCGPYDAHSMSVFERFHTIFKKLVRSKQHEMQSIANHYTYLVNGDRWRCENAQMTPTTTPFASTLGAAVDVDYGAGVINIIKLGGKEKDLAVLDARLYAQVQDMWALTSKVYDVLRDRYRTELRSSGQRGHVHTAVDAAQIPASTESWQWRPTRGRELTDEEKQMVDMKPNVQRFSKAVLRGKNEFRTMRSEARNKTCNSVIKEWYHEREGGLGKGYAMIEDMFVHQMYEGGPSRHFVQGKWLDEVIDAQTSLQKLTPAGLPLLRHNPNNNFNKHSCFALLENIVPYNIALLPNDLDVPDGDVFVVIDPEARLGRCLPPRQ